MAVLALVASAMNAEAAPEAELWRRWTAHDPAAQTRIDHGAWTRFLARNVLRDAAGIARLSYGAVDAADRAGLARYIDGLAKVPISRYRRAEQFAYWINLYNALTVRVVLDHYPVDSIRDIRISPGWFSVGPWRRKLIEIEGVAISLDDIEHRILRPIWRDPRLHYAVNCAAIGCPNLGAAAFTAEGAEAMLDAAARLYVNHRRGVRITDEGLVLSRLYSWYRADFGADDATVIAHLRHFAAPDLAARLLLHRAIAAYEYDWALNDRPVSQSSASSKVFK